MCILLRLYAQPWLLVISLGILPLVFLSDVSSISTKEVFAATETGIPASSNGHATPSCSKTVLGDTSRNRRRERPLREYVPNLYICVLEGTLLTNGDLKARSLNRGLCCVSQERV